MPNKTYFQSKKFDTLLIIALIIWSILAGYSAFNDLSISETFVDQNTGWAIFLEQYGELPGTIIIIWGILIFSVQFDSSSTFIFAVTQLILTSAMSLILLYMSYILLFNFTSSSDVFFEHSLLLFAVFLILNVTSIAYFRKINFRFSSILTILSRIIIGMSLLGYLFSIQFIKLLWGRVRYRDLDLFHTNFTEWYIINGINGHQSFPSGHAAMGWMLLPLFLLVLKKNCFIKTFSIVLILILAMAITLSRVIIGAHYASDVLFGSFFMIITFLILYKKYYLRDEKEEQVLK
jgi:membrane-associated phospholipid phosphatase